jgi:predicted nucleic acid-binding protein
MKDVLVDTSVWSLAFRRSKPDEREIAVTNELISLIRELRIVIIGPVRQELLSGISEQDVFENLRERMTVFTDYAIQTADYELAAEYSNLCRKNGIQGSHTDFLICAVAARNRWEIFTEDHDFLSYQKYLPITLYKF